MRINLVLYCLHWKLLDQFFTFSLRAHFFAFIVNLLTCDSSILLFVFELRRRSCVMLILSLAEFFELYSVTSQDTTLSFETSTNRGLVLKVKKSR